MKNLLHRVGSKFDALLDRVFRRFEQPAPTVFVPASTADVMAREEAFSSPLFLELAENLSPGLTADIVFSGAES